MFQIMLGKWEEAKECLATSSITGGMKEVLV